MDIVVHGRNVEVPDHYRQHVADKLERLERYDSKLINVDVELQHERNPRQAEIAQRVEITLRTKGPVIRSEAVAADFYSALDAAVARLETRVRKAADRRRIHHGNRTPTSVAEATADAADAAQAASDIDRVMDEYNGVHHDSDEFGPGKIIREKSHPDTPMSVDEALENMELVGHDFYLFMCAETLRPTVVYRRHAYDYGLIRLSGNGVNASVAQADDELETAAV
ncbi:SSU ribosomal protein S30P /sigma 54 modulation protein [Antricoccus suffuscus]|uniref:Ribosome hibernation promoting factor n=1 Tax=Antricoccus suffuscus TaxID=1629062 RepID=A0A2T0ZQK1_9ACTN|nr:ribosome-associated translation inhibitor RaiA [Antricoccus suffuscus]PRZ38587.1 SSU ribosomal protein S30P /sigma 54 modulation protein [Antricoccus suffuscus]